MKAIDIILVLAIASAIVLAVSYLVRSRKQGGTCSCGCAGCAAACPRRQR